MQTINDRIGIILENSKKTKTDFAKSLKVSQQYISKLVKTGNPSDMLIEDICQKYNVREEWLRTGQEPMTPDADIEFADICFQIGVKDERARKVLEEYLALNDEDKKLFMNFLERLSKAGN